MKTLNELKRVAILSLALCGTSAMAQGSPTAMIPESARAARVVTPSLSASSPLPRFVKFSGSSLDAEGKPRTGTVGITFAIYSQPKGGAPVWLETQNVKLDNNGRYTVLLGATQADGLPADLFNSGEARWMGTQVQVAGEPEQGRVLLVSVPYAMKSGDAETLGGRPASDYLLAGSHIGNASPTLTGREVTAAINNGATPSGTVNQIAKFDSSTTIMDSQIFDNGTAVGIGTTTPTTGYKLEVNGNIKANNIIYSDHFNSFSRTSVYDCGMGLATPFTVTGYFNTMTNDGFDGFRGETSHPCGNGMEGIANSPIGGNAGVFGQTNSNIGAAVEGESNNTTGTGVSYGMKGYIDGPKGVSVIGFHNDPGGAFPPANPGDVIGVEGIVDHVNAIAGAFDNTAVGGKVFSGRKSGVETLSIDNAGNVNAQGRVTAATFAGSGALLTNLAAGALSGTASINISGNATTATTAGSVTNGVVTTGAYADPSWITSLAGSKITGTVANATNAVNATNAANATNATNAGTAVNFSGSLSGDVTGTQGATVISSLAASKLTGTVSDTNLSTNVALLNASNAFSPTSDITGVTVKQTSVASPTKDIFAVQNNAGTSTYLKVDNSGAVSWTATATGNISGNAATATTATSAGSVTNGVVTTGSYADPIWITSLAGSKITGTVANATKAVTVTNGVVTTGSYADPIWITSLAGSKITGTVANATNATNAGTAVNFSGSLSGDVTGTQGATVISSLAASKLTGTVSDTNLSTNVALLNASNAFSPTSDITGVTVKQTSAAAPTKDIFSVQNNAGTSTYLKVDNAGAVSWTATATGNISGNAATATTATSAGSVTNGVVTTGSYADPIWITSLASAKLTGTITNSQLTHSNLTVNAGTGLSGGGAVSLGGSTTLNLTNTAVTAGTYTKVTVDAQGRATAGTSAGFSDLSGSLAAAQMPALTGDVTSSAGSTSTTLASVVTAGTNTKLTYDAKGRVTAGTQAAFSDLSGTITAAQLPALTGDVTSNAGSAATTLANSGVTAGTYTKVTVDAKGRATVGNTLVASDIPNLSASYVDLSSNQTVSGTKTLTGKIDATTAANTLPIKAVTIATTPATCTANKELIIKTDATAGQQMFICNSTGNGWNLLGDGLGSNGVSFNQVDVAANTVNLLKNSCTTTYTGSYPAFVSGEDIPLPTATGSLLTTSSILAGAYNSAAVGQMVVGWDTYDWTAYVDSGVRAFLHVCNHTQTGVFVTGDIKFNVRAIN